MVRPKKQRIVLTFKSTARKLTFVWHEILGADSKITMLILPITYYSEWLKPLRCGRKLRNTKLLWSIIWYCTILTFSFNEKNPQRLMCWPRWNSLANYALILFALLFFSLSHLFYFSVWLKKSNVILRYFIKFNKITTY